MEVVGAKKQLDGKNGSELLFVYLVLHVFFFSIHQVGLTSRRLRKIAVALRKIQNLGR